MTTIHTLGDSVLDCARYNERGVMPGHLLGRNDDRLFPEFRRRDLSTILARDVSVDHRARDGATVAELGAQLRGMRVHDEDVVVMSIGGNDLLAGLLDAPDHAFSAFGESVKSVLAQIPAGKVFVANVYDPSFGDDARNFLGDVDARLARSAHRRVNKILASTASHGGASLVDLHAHFLSGDPTWFALDIEPSLVGASEVRRLFLDAWEAARRD
jgi:lysophospholipase L1-like esterase